MAIKYKWLAARLREQLPDYATQSRHRLPTEAELAAHYQVSRQTVRQALAVRESRWNCAKLERCAALQE